ncbi:hypothetical protein FA95DRAFT_1558816 [Auriscalpium vulgare]|uniref:Uncharacterized protein n=1 Tax=Auriscalpium vulgare TaxID=40419 RepID=A0ACB8RVR9_9AGAM|nr:hypothetical protein FA95DRAFT_1558816 [Auriscalpium vulgare]
MAGLVGPRDILDLILKLKSIWDEVADNSKDLEVLTNQVHKDLTTLYSLTSSYGLTQHPAKKRASTNGSIEEALDTLFRSLSECLRRCKELKPPKGHFKGVAWKAWNKGDVRKEIQSIQKSIGACHQQFTSSGIFIIAQDVSKLRQDLRAEIQAGVVAGIKQAISDPTLAVKLVSAENVDKPTAKKCLRAAKQDMTDLPHSKAPHSRVKDSYLRLKCETLESILKSKDSRPSRIVRKASESSLDFARNVIVTASPADPSHPKPDAILLCLDAINASHESEMLSPAAANSIGELSITLCQIGLKREACSLAKHVVNAYRVLTDRDHKTYWPRLAHALDNRAAILNSLNAEPGESYACAWEAYQIFQGLAKNSSVSYMHSEAIALKNCANALCAKRKYSDALPLIQSSVRILCNLAHDSPHEFAPSLSQSLNNLSECLTNLDDKEGALAAAIEAVDLVATEENAHPNAFLPILATCLFTKATCCEDMGKTQDGLQAAERVVAIRRKLYKSDRYLYGSQLSDSLALLCDLHKALDDHSPEALMAIEQAVTIDRAIGSKEDSAESRSAYASHLHRYAMRLTQAGQKGNALGIMDEAVRVRRDLSHVDAAAYSADHGNSLYDFAVLLYQKQEYKRARKVMQDAVNVRTRLVHRDSNAHKATLDNALKALRTIEKAMAG